MTWWLWILLVITLYVAGAQLTHWLRLFLVWIGFFKYDRYFQESHVLSIWFWPITWLGYLLAPIYFFCEALCVGMYCALKKFKLPTMLSTEKEMAAQYERAHFQQVKLKEVFPTLVRNAQEKAAKKVGYPVVHQPKEKE
jgi:hypothetical protein